MKLELYNISGHERKVPYYNYGGYMLLKPEGTFSIEPEQADFYKPYARVGIVVRQAVSDVEEEFDSVEEIHVENTEDTKVENTEDTKVEENEESNKLHSEGEDIPIVYTADMLEGKSFDELKGIKDSLGIEGTSNSKKGLIDLIVGQ
jgi:hypothetical protein